MKILNNNAKLAFFTARRRDGDLSLISRYSGYSLSHVSNIVAGRRKINERVAVIAYYLSKPRKKNSQLVG
jgi:hypothetical protein